jgi:DNA invertase Pin-like site-specific DNA recombinase
MNAVIYCRVSSKEQIEGTSLESQEIACCEYAARNHLAVIRVFVERGESAKFADRPQLLDLIAFCGKRENAIGVLLVWKVDRLARNVGDHFNIKAGLLKHNVRVESVTEPIDEHPEGKLLETILAGFAQFDNDLRAARTVQGMQHKIHEGLFPWMAPLGYETRTRGTKKTQPDQPVQPAFGILQRGWNEFATGNYTKSEILRLMTGWGLRTRNGRAISNQSIDNIFCDAFYAGILRDPWSGKEYEGQHIPMISRETFAEVQQVIAGRNRAIPHVSIRVEFPLRAFARCPGCEQPLTASFSRGRSKAYPYYHCNRKGCDVRGNHSLQDVHEEFIKFLRPLSLTRDQLDRIKRHVGDLLSSSIESDRSSHAKRKSDIDRITNQQQQLIRMKMDQLITDEEYLAQRLILTGNLTALEAQQFDMPSDPDCLLREIEQVAQPLGDLVATWQSISVELQQRFQRWALPKGYVIGDIGTAQRGRLFSLFGTSDPTDSTLVPPEGQSWNQLAEEIEVLASIAREAALYAN